MKCFACGEKITNPYINCPNCGYRFTVDTNMYCPNSNFGVCAITENMCTKGIDFQECSIKNKADKEAPF